MLVSEIASALTGLKTAIDIVRVIKDLDKDLAAVEMKRHAVDLMDALVEARGKVQDVKFLLQDKDAEIAKLKKQLDITKIIDFRTPFYYLVRDGKDDGPFCQCCYDRDGKLSRPIEKTRGAWRCNVCGTYYEDENYKPRAINPVPTRSNW